MCMVIKFAEQAKQHCVHDYAGSLKVTPVNTPDEFKLNTLITVSICTASLKCLSIASAFPSLHLHLNLQLSTGSTQTLVVQQMLFKSTVTSPPEKRVYSPTQHRYIPLSSQH